ncbi:hypothetical protein HCU66_12560 [Pseudomonas frederiksbergensis]|uniref:hypothetical protein n=1 Tax=Pseudomonas frederiksbergensis TaxID=104087 RepID=UPI001980BE17|nr:hypothetical protein [Pseudomonas frederiksbergensis]MBN3863059.1 hypothetical protein [Pseudomonas frederiksbergensis]
MAMAFAVSSENYIAFGVGDFVNCTAGGADYISAEIKKVDAPFVTIGTTSGDKKFHQKDLKINIRVVPPPPPTTQPKVDRVEQQLLVKIKEPEISLKSYAGDLYAFSNTRATTVTVSTTYPAIVATTFNDDGTVTTNVSPNNSPDSGGGRVDIPPVWAPGHEKRLRHVYLAAKNPMYEGALLKMYGK